MGRWLLALAASYVVGSIPTAYLMVKRLKRVDVRTIGSGNVGATNVTRAAGFTAGFLVFLIDAAKGLMAVWMIAPWLLADATPFGRLLCGVAAVIGHIFPVFLGFQGGKGVATTLGVLLGTSPLILGACLLVLIICLAIWRYMSLASMIAAITIPLMQQLTGHPSPEVALGALLCVLIILRHRANIQRLLRGTEPKFGARGSSNHR